jgi:hypothetical protein
MSPPTNVTNTYAVLPMKATSIAPQICCNFRYVTRLAVDS